MTAEVCADTRCSAAHARRALDTVAGAAVVCPVSGRPGVGPGPRAGSHKSHLVNHRARCSRSCVLSSFHFRGRRRIVIQIFSINEIVMNRPTQTAASYGYSGKCRGMDSVTASASVIVPLIMQRFQPKSVLDVGCGAGDWLSEFLRHGATLVRGYDGQWFPQAGLKIPADCFRAIDFCDAFPRAERFDLAMSLEVAEHVSASVGQKLVLFLCESSDLIVFSAAVPGQGGYAHINEQPQSYWIGVFQSHGYSAYDLIRPLVWTNEHVSFWYRQNCLVFANSNGAKAHGLTSSPFIASLIHPELFDLVRNPKNYSIKSIVRHAPHYVLRALRRFAKSKGPL